MTVEIERNPLVVRQGAAAVACIAAAAVAMPVIAHRAAEQRSAPETVETASYQTPLGAELFAGGSEPTARLQLVASRSGDGLRARGQGPLMSNGADTHALLVQAALRGPIADTTAPEADKEINPRELRCLSEAIYYEARGESRQGQAAVAEVVVNRARSGVYPGSICGVVYQGSHRSTGCQFTFTCDGSLNRRPHGAAWTRAQAVARQTMGGYLRPVTGRATHYHTTAVDPRWSAMLVETGRIGEHIFYRFPNRAERARLQEAAARNPRPAYRASTDEAPGIVDGMNGDRIQGVIAGELPEAQDPTLAPAGAPIATNPVGTEAAATPEGDIAA